MRKFGLIGYPLGHSFSKKYFTQKFIDLGLDDHQYDLYEMEDVKYDFPALLDDPELEGINVTVPHKQNILPFLTRLEKSAERVGAVNVIKRVGDELIGYNSDYYGFMESLKLMIGTEGKVKSALICGTGGASKAIKAVLEDMDIKYKTVSRSKEKADVTYKYLMEHGELVKNADLLINCTPLGTYPKVDTAPELPYEELHAGQFLYDLVYNPEVTRFLQEGKSRGAATKNGLDMLHLQAEKSWEIWNSK
jgi:shikimate dehydrogenase